MQLTGAVGVSLDGSSIGAAGAPNTSGSQGGWIFTSGASCRLRDPRRFQHPDVPARIPHPNKEAARRVLEEAVAGGESLCTDAEVLQETLRRYVAIRRPVEIHPAFDALLAIVDVLFPIERADVERARRLLATTPSLSARDLT